MVEYRVGEVVGKGAIATVHRVGASDGRTYAGKILHASHAQDAEAVRRFAQEAELLRGVESPNIVRVFGVIETRGRSVLLMELVEGPTLARRIARDAPIDEATLCSIAKGIAQGLARAHAAGIIHRDLKPANVLMAGIEGEMSNVPKIADFGMARASSFSGVDVGAFAVLGTPDYMAPECMDPLAVDPRTDLYSLGAIMYEMATGEPPYPAATPFGVLEAHAKEPIPALPEHYGRDLRELISALLAKSPADRPQSAAVVVEALGRIEGGDRALAVMRRGGDATCAGCGQELLLEVGACMHCGRSCVHLEPGRCAVVVVGPGETGDKVDSVLRERLLRWLDGSPGLGLDTKRLEASIPRLPFTLATKVSATSAQSLVEAMDQLGIRAEAVEGGAHRVPAMRKKTWVMTGRVAAIVGTSVAGLWGNLTAHWSLFLVPVAAMAVVAGITGYRAMRSVTRSGRQRAAVPDPLRPALSGLRTSLPAITRTRHRHGLRAVVERVLAAAERGTQGLGPKARADIQLELANALELATAATLRLDALDEQIGEGDLREPSDRVRSLLHERDRWAAALLELTATLDGLQARLGAALAARALGDGGDGERLLDDLRVRVEALEEVQTT